MTSKSDITRIFISRPITEVGKALFTFESQGGKLIAESLVKFESVFFDSPDQTDVIFFSSMRSATYFLNQHSFISPIPKIACAGQETARKLKETYQLSVDFIASNAGNPSEEAVEFHKWLGSRTVLFPKSEQSLNSYSKGIPNHQKKEVTVYRTLSDLKSIPSCDLYIFSSPSNAKSFLACNQLPENAKCIAWGTSTMKYLSSQQISPIHSLKTGTLEELDDYINELRSFNSEAHEI
ncbi:MAG: uroporphyrinogen-III synthase [Flavobacteriales bacterium]